MVINTNQSALSSATALAQSSSMLSKSLQRLSTGSKINSPADDAAGLAVSMRFSAQINRIQSANDNVGNAISFSQTQDGFLQKVNDALNRMSELAVSAQDVTKTDGDRSKYQAEFNTLQNYIADVAGKNFNGVALFAAATLSVTTDGDPTANTKFDMGGVNLNSGNIASAITATNAIDIGTVGAATTALTTVKSAIDDLATFRGNIGANISRLTMTSDQLGVLKQNLSAANSRITDVDVAQESSQFARYNILVQAGTAMLAQANASPQSALRLLQ
jgi:flagellin